MRIVKYQFSKSGSRDAGPQIAQHGHKCRCRDGEGAGESEMFITLAVVYGRQGINGQIRGQLFDGASQQEIVDQRIGSQREMMTVLLDGCRGKHEQGGIPRERVDLLPVEIRETALVRYPRFHGTATPVFAVCGRKLIIFPGFISPLRSYRCLANSWKLSAPNPPPPSTLFT